jgi:hypothetical protein
VTTIWVMVLIVSVGGYKDFAVTNIEFATRDGCLRAQQFVARQPNTTAAYCIPADRKG